jgi:hypothetical protein
VKSVLYLQYKIENSFHVESLSQWQRPERKSKMPFKKGWLNNILGMGKLWSIYFPNDLDLDILERES